jgi:hypothetical protein
MAGRGKQVLVVIDDADSTYHAAQKLSAELKGCRIILRKAANGAREYNPTDGGELINFQCSDLLGADVFFLGCEKPRPPSFLYLEQLLNHINLAGRFCGVFSAGSLGALNYLKGLLSPCDAVQGTPFRINLKDGEGQALKTWATEILSCKSK